ncbi:hypothetical protein SAMN02745221_00173 [Thermosyntropha lipolytica DSM 11003]|uniref:Spore Coat Protein U domain-containing protein n=1 Tax=Thermosyntropha lipolytica DSM 11003 TaxID=1123382 RepID=A0A1M5JQ95_9FIRM|nr:hypothetical protein [Thermosyntropha lipolytica]SHG42460.1 hypothetical protein SAMN02745221_00173 [Thermosyntropha lipolytica DSM 11003]
MKKYISVFIIGTLILFLPLSAWGANLAVVANIERPDVLELGPSMLSFEDVHPGIPTEPKAFNTICYGNNQYMLTISGTNLSGPATLSASVVQYREAGMSNWFVNSTAPQNLLTSPAMATPEGDVKEFEIRLVVPPSALNGTYVGQIIITMVPQ